MLSVNEQGGAPATAVILNGVGRGPALNGKNKARKVLPKFSEDRIDKDVTKGIWVTPQMLGYPELLHIEKLLLGAIDGLTNKETPCWAGTKFLANRIKLSERRTRALLQSLEEREFIIRIREKRVVAKALGQYPDIIQKWITDETMVEAEIDDEIDRQNGRRQPQNGRRQPRSILEERTKEKKERTREDALAAESGSLSSFSLARLSEEPIALTTATTDAFSSNQPEERHCQPEPERTQDVLAENPGTHISGSPHCGAISDSHCGAIVRNGSDQAKSADEPGVTRPDAAPESAPGRVPVATATQHNGRRRKRSGKRSNRQPTEKEVIDYCLATGRTEFDAKDRYLRWCKTEFPSGKWQADIEHYALNGWLPSQKEKKAQDASQIAEQERQRREAEDRRERQEKARLRKEEEEAQQREYLATRQNNETFGEWSSRRFREILAKNRLTTHRQEQQNETAPPVQQEQQNKTVPRKSLVQLEKELAEQRAEWQLTGKWPERTTNQ